MGKFFKDSYASTYAARNVKEALDKLIDVLQSPTQVRKLIVGTAPRKSIVKLPGKIPVEAPANTPLWTVTAASVAKKHTTWKANHADKQDSIASGNNSIERRKTSTSSSSGSRASESSDCGDLNSDHIPVGRFTQLWKRSLRDYPGGGIRSSRERQRSSPPQLEAGWSSVPCKSGDFDFGC